MTDVRSIVDSWFEPNERHPGHEPQSVHAGKNKAKKLLNNTPSGVDWAKIVDESQQMAPAATGHGPNKFGTPKKKVDFAAIVDEAAKMAPAATGHGSAKFANSAPKRPRRPKSSGTVDPGQLAKMIAGEEDEMPKPRRPRKPRDPRSADGLNYDRGYTDPETRGGKPGDPIRFVASTAGVKRDGLDLRANGWKIDNFRKSPVFLWAHDKTSLPIGRVDATVGNKLLADVVFDQEDEFARKVESKYRRGFLSAVSVGWDFIDADGQRMDVYRLRPDEVTKVAFYDLTELSGIPVPADPDALMESTRAGLRSLGRELVALYDEQENGEATAEEVRAALHAELARLGIPPEQLRRAARRPARKAGFFMPKTTAPAVSGIAPDAARSLLAAFNL